MSMPSLTLTSTTPTPDLTGLTREERTDASAEMQPQTLPIPTGIAWVMIERIIGGAPLERIAQIAAYGATLLGEDQDEARIFERFRKYLRRQVKRGHW